MRTMTDAADDIAPPLTERQAAFVTEYLKGGDGSATAACQRAGISPRKAASMMSNPDVLAEIGRRQSNGAATATGDDEIDRALAAYDVAKSAGNAAGMVAATTLLAKLRGRLDGEPEPKPPAPSDIAAVKRAFVAYCKDELGVDLAPFLPPGWPGEPPAPVVAPTPVVPPAPVVEAAPVERLPLLGEREVLTNGAAVEFVQTTDGPNGDRSRTWAIYDAQGAWVTYRRSRTDALAYAAALPGNGGAS